MTDTAENDAPTHDRESWDNQSTEDAYPADNDATRPCFGCGHVHLTGSPGRCWEAACDPRCTEDHGDGGPYVFSPVEGDA